MHDTHSPTPRSVCLLIGLSVCLFIRLFFCLFIRFQPSGGWVKQTWLFCHRKLGTRYTRRTYFQVSEGRGVRRDIGVEAPLKRRHSVVAHPAFGIYRIKRRKDTGVVVPR